MNDDICIIDGDSRAIYLSASAKVSGVESDLNVKTIYFRCPKIVDNNIDLSNMALQIKYINALGQKGIYIIQDIRLEEGYLNFSWDLPKEITLCNGNNYFIICATKTDSNGTVIQKWNTSIAQFKTLKGIEITHPSITQEEVDVITQLIELSQNSVIKSESAAQQAATEAERIKNTFPPGGQKGQVLAKKSDEDLDFIWMTFSGDGVTGENGATFTPSVSAEGIISWTNDKNLPNPEPVSIKGDKGDKGEQGLQGAKGDKGDKGDTGAKGEQGQPGVDGKTPVKGVDYWNEEDKAEIVENVLAALPRAEVEKF